MRDLDNNGLMDIVEGEPVLPVSYFNKFILL
jgi:hypothetical protein